MQKERAGEKSGEGGGGVGAHRHESGMAERELAGVAVHQVQAYGQDDVNPDGEDDVVIVGVDRTFKLRNDEAERESQKEIGPGMTHQTFSRSTFPRRPAGLNNKMRMRMAKATASR